MSLKTSNDYTTGIGRPAIIVSATDHPRRSVVYVYSWSMAGDVRYPSELYPRAVYFDRLR